MRSFVKITKALFFISSFYILTLFGNELPIKQYSVNEGLSQSLVTAIHQDSKGFLWVGTGYGLNRFDGLSFRSYKYSYDDPHSIKGNTVRGIIEDPYGNLWVGTDKGLNYYNRRSEKFILIDPFKNNITCIPFFADKNSVYYWDSYKGIVQIDFLHKRISIISSSGNLHKPFLYDSKNSILYNVDLQEQIISINIKTKEVDTLYCEGSEIKKLQLQNDQLFFCSSDSIYILDLFRYGNPVIKSRNEPGIRNMIIDKNDHLWIFNEKETTILDRGLNTLKVLTNPNPDLYSSFDFENITQTYSDKSGNIWIGSDGKGLARINYNNQNFKDPYNLPELKNNDFIKDFFEDQKGNIYIGTYRSGFTILKKDSFIKINKLPWNNNYFTVAGFVQGNSHNEIIIATADGLLLYDINKEQLSPFIEPAPLPYQITAILKRKNGDILIGTEAGSYSADITGNTITYSKVFDNENRTAALFETNDGGLFIFHNIEYQYIDQKGNKIRIFKDPNGKMPENTSFKVLFEDRDNNWIGSNYGLIKLSKNYELIRIFGLKEGLPDLMIYGILKDEKENLWLSTNKGLSKFNIKKGTFRNYSITDGLRSYEFNSGAYCKLSTGQMAFGGINGFNIFHPDDIKNNKNIASIELIKVTNFDKEIDPDIFSHKNKIPEFSWFNNTFNFEVAALEYTQPDENKLAFKLEGLDEEWYTSRNKGSIRFTSLQPGNYKLFIKAANNDGIWSGPKLMAQFTISAPFWQTWWFIATIALSFLILIIGVIYFFTTIKYRRRLIELERQREIGEIRNKISRDIHDDIGSGLTRISLLTEVIKANSKKDSNELSESLNKLSAHSRELASNLGEIVWTVNPMHDNLNSLLSYLRNYIAGYLEDTNLNYEIDFPEMSYDATINPELRRNLFMVIKESLNNIIKHSEATKASVVLKIADQKIFFEVSDNGIGIDQKKNPFGNGLINMQQRIEKIGGKIWITNNYPTGTKIKISVGIY